MSEDLDHYPSVTAVADLKERLEGQQRIIDRVARSKSVHDLNYRSELDALWACVEFLAQVADGVPHEEVIVRDYFARTPTRRRKWWKRFKKD